MNTRDLSFMRVALRLARRGYGLTSPNPMVGAVLVRNGMIIGQGWHHRAGELHAEIEAIRDAQARGNQVSGATLYVTLEPCCTHGRTPPCTEAIKRSGIKRVVAGATDPNPAHAGRAFAILKRACIPVTRGLLAADAERLNETFNHWIVRRTPFVTVKTAMTLDGKIGAATGESKWITGERARACGMRMRQAADAILVGINTVLADDPSLTVRPAKGSRSDARWRAGSSVQNSKPRRIVLDARARTPLSAKVVVDGQAALTTVVVSRSAPRRRVAALAKRVNVLVAPARGGKINLRWLLSELGREHVTSLLVEGGGEVNASFLLDGLAQRIAFFYAPKILGGRGARKAVAGEGAKRWADVITLREIVWRKLGPDLLLTARVG